MKRSQAFATSVLTLSLGIAGLMPTVSTYAAGSTTCDAGDKHVDASVNPDFGATMNNLNTTDPGSVDIVTDGASRTTYTLQQNICVDNVAGTANQGLVVSGDVILDLNGHHIVTDDAGARLINVGTKDANSQGILTIVGAGTVAASQGIPVRVYGGTSGATPVYGSVYLSNNAVLDGDDYGLMVGANSNKSAYGVGVVVDGSTVKGAQGGMFVNGNVQNGDVKIQIDNGSTVTGGTDSGIYAAGKANWEIKDSTVTGYTGISVKSGSLELDNATVTGNGAKNTPDQNNSNGMGETGAAIAIESNPGYAGEVSVNISGGTYTSEHNSTFLHYANGNYTADGEITNFTISHGTFNSAANEPAFTGFDDGKSAANNTIITGGTFSNQAGIEKFLPQGSELVTDENGNFVVVRPDGMGYSPNDGTISSSITTKVVAKEAPKGDAPNTGVMANNRVSAKATTVSLMAKLASFITAGGVATILIRRRRQKHEA